MFVVSEADTGTPEPTWLHSPQIAACPPLDVPASGRVVVIAPHPDDEVLAIGGTLLRLLRAGCTIEIVAITDGEGSHPQSTAITRAELVVRRSAERTEALHRLGIPHAAVARLGIPDGGVRADEHLPERLVPLLRGASLCLAPWDRDGHPDHDASGRAAAMAATAAHVRLVQYPIWAWHWASPESEHWPWSRARRVELEPSELQAKNAALAAYHTQIEPVGPALADAPVLPRAVLARFQRPFEVLFT